MITENMNSHELFKEITKDKSFAVAKSMYWLPEVRRMAIKSRNKFFRKVYNYCSPNKNNWLVFVEHYIKDLITVYVTYYYDKKGLNAVMVAPNGVMTHYTAHFFLRYKERFLVDSDLTGLELVKHFIQNNPVSSIKPVAEDGEYITIFGTFNDGIGLGYAENIPSGGIVHYKTFISEEMLKGKQVDVNGNASELLKEYWKENYDHKLKKLENAA